MEALQDLEVRIVRTPARTVEGAAAKARIIKKVASLDIDAGLSLSGDVMAVALADDLERLADM